MKRWQPEICEMWNVFYTIQFLNTPWLTISSWTARVTNMNQRGVLALPAIKTLHDCMECIECSCGYLCLYTGGLTECLWPREGSQITWRNVIITVFYSVNVIWFDEHLLDMITFNEVSLKVYLITFWSSGRNSEYEMFTSECGRQRTWPQLRWGQETCWCLLIVDCIPWDYLEFDIEIPLQRMLLHFQPDSALLSFLFAILAFSLLMLVSILKLRKSRIAKGMTPVRCMWWEGGLCVQTCQEDPRPGLVVSDVRPVESQHGGANVITEQHISTLSFDLGKPSK